MGPVLLERFKLDGLLGSGADYEVHAAIDTESGRPVVVKRPNPDYLARGLHSGVELLSESLIETHRVMDGSTPYLAPLVGYTETGSHDGYFGDTQAAGYRVLVQERARGIPLMGAMMDKFRGVPVGLGQNLFALHPLAVATEGSPFAVQEQLLDVEEAFRDAGHLLLDLGPHNVYFDPEERRITVIDAGTVPTSGPGAQGGAASAGKPRDLHDFFLELLTFYCTPEIPPAEVAGYREPYGIRGSPVFEEQLGLLLQDFDRAEDSPVRETALEVIHRVGDRSYQSLSDFRRDFGRYLSAVQERNQALPDLPELKRTWLEAMNMLFDRHWNKFMFDPDSELAKYRTI